VGDRDAMVRVRDAMRDILEPAEHLTVTQTDSLVALTAPDGRTTRLAPDGSKIKDENTGVERRSRWEGGQLISEISGIGPGRMTQTFSVDREPRQLRIVVTIDRGRGQPPRTVTSIYDPDPS
jgi:hypothetical protein